MGIADRTSTLFQIGFHLRIQLLRLSSAQAILYSKLAQNLSAYVDTDATSDLYGQSVKPPFIWNTVKPLINMELPVKPLTECQ